MGSRRQISDQLDRALLQIETEYITDPDRRTLEWWYEQLGNRLPLDDLRTYAAHHKWYERRQAFWRGVQAQWLRQQGQRLIQMRSDELREAAELRAAVYSFCTPRVQSDGTVVWPIRPSSYEGMLRAFVQLDAMVEAKRDAIADAIDPLLAAVERDKAEAAESAEDEGGRELPFDKEEMRALAHGLLRRRRAQRRQRLGIEDDDADDDRLPGAEEAEAEETEAEEAQGAEAGQAGPVQGVRGMAGPNRSR